MGTRRTPDTVLRGRTVSSARSGGRQASACFDGCGGGCGVFGFTGGGRHMPDGSVDAREIINAVLAVLPAAAASRWSSAWMRLSHVREDFL